MNADVVIGRNGLQRRSWHQRKSEAVRVEKTRVVSLRFFE